MNKISSIVISLILSYFAQSLTVSGQVMSREDSLHLGLDPSVKNVIISGYGEAKYSYDSNLETAVINFTRNVLFVGYRFNEKVTFFSEIELEDAKVDPEGGEIALEQAVLKFDLNRQSYLLAGLFIPRIGIMNENHLPTTFNGNSRPMVERWIIPATWRELGFGYYGRSNSIAGLNWSIAVMNGLNVTGINGESGIRDARYEGRDASASNIATTASVMYFFNGIRLQASTYYGGTSGMSSRAADSLNLNSGLFGTPVSLSEFNVQYKKHGLTLKALASYVSISDADRINTAFGSNAPSTMYGYYAEAGYNILGKKAPAGRELNVFVRYEALDRMAEVPVNGIKDEIHNQQFIVAGLTYLPFHGIAIKADWTHMQTGYPNPALYIIPAPNAPAYQNTNNFYQLGIAYNF
jgi:hypothetical protein